MNPTAQEERLALQLVRIARQAVPAYAAPQDHIAGVEAVLTLAAQYASTGADFSVLQIMDYPDTTRAQKTV